ncbi:MAG: hypothetical protein GY856_12120 [bacterium]|nr:hypothetical protein [bacterium]
MKKRTILTGIFVVATALSLSLLTAKPAQACELCADFTFTYPDGYQEERRMCWYAPTGGYIWCTTAGNYSGCVYLLACSLFGGDDRNDFELPDGLYQHQERVELADIATLAPPGCSKINKPKRVTTTPVYYTL